MPALIGKPVVKDAVDDPNVAADVYAARDEQVADLLDEAAARADANGRKTVQPRDL